jgi:hypothetical protein
MFALKPLSHDSVSGAIGKAERYRLLNEPAEAESICRDILEIEPENQQALILLVLALSDQICDDAQAFTNALLSAGRLHTPYDRAYYAGIVWERRAKGRYNEGGRSLQHTVYEWMQKALQLFEQAEHLRAPGNDDSLLRWNTCVRFLARHPELTARTEEASEPILSE